MDPIVQLTEWLASDFVALNTELEQAYYSERTDLLVGEPRLESLKAALLRGGGQCVQAVAAVPHLPASADGKYRLLGLVGHYLAACKRHEIDLSGATAARDAAWTISMRIGTTLGVAPRFVFAHQALFNTAAGGRVQTFTALEDEILWVRLNASAVLAYRKASRALADIPGLGVSNPLVLQLLHEARSGLADVLRLNRSLAQQLDVDRFCFNIRPYFKSYTIGSTEYRGANAGDFAAINQIDILLGLCSPADPFYQRVINDKARYVPPNDLRAMRNLDDLPSILGLFIDELERVGATPEWTANATAFLAVLKAHGAAYAFHHQRLVRPFFERPARTTGSVHPAGVTSSGPPLDEVMRVLTRLLELRTARVGVSAASVIARLREALGERARAAALG